MIEETRVKMHRAKITLHKEREHRECTSKKIALDRQSWFEISRCKLTRNRSKSGKNLKNRKHRPSDGIARFL